MAEGQRRLGALLVEMGVIDEAQLARALEVQRRSARRLGRVLVEQGAIDERILFQALSRQLRIDLWDRSSLPSRSSARALVAREAAFRARCLPLVRMEEGERDILVVATSDPLAPSAAKLVRALSDRGASVRWLLAPDRELEQALVTAYGPERARTTPSVVEVVKGRPEAAVARPPPDPGATRRTAPVPAIGISSAGETGHTLLADDAVLEVVEDAPMLGGLIRQTPELYAASLGSDYDVSGTLGFTRWGEIVSEAIPDDHALEQALEAATERASTDEDGPEGRTHGAGPRPPDESSDLDGEPDAWSDRSESEERDAGWAPEGSVALARLAIRRADGGVREVIRPRRTHDPRKDQSMPSIPADSLSDLAVLTPVPHVKPDDQGEHPVEHGPDRSRERSAAPPLDPPADRPLDPPAAPPLDPPADRPLDPPAAPPLDPPAAPPLDPPAAPSLDPPADRAGDPPSERRPDRERAVEAPPEHRPDRSDALGFEPPSNVLTDRTGEPPCGHPPDHPTDRPRDRALRPPEVPGPHAEPREQPGARDEPVQDVTDGEDPGSTLSVPVLRPPPTASPADRVDASGPAGGPPEPMAPAWSGSNPAEPDDEKSDSAPAASGLSLEPSADAPTQTLDVSHLAPEVLARSPAEGAGSLDHLSFDLAPPPAALTEDDAIRERAAELHARLIRFAAGEDLPEALREDALRVVIDVLLDAGFLEEPAIAKALASAVGRSSPGG